MDKQIELIRNTVPTDDLLLQLAEECTELAKAALKVVRIMHGINKTPVKMVDAEASLFEEVADVRLCEKVVGYDFSQNIEEIMNIKLNRWVERLKNGEITGN